MRLSAAQPVVQKGNRAHREEVVTATLVQETVTTVQPHVRCFRRNALHAERTLRFLLSHTPADRFIARIVITK